VSHLMQNVVWISVLPRSVTIKARNLPLNTHIVNMHCEYCWVGRRSFCRILENRAELAGNGFWEFSRVSVAIRLVSVALVGKVGFHMSGEVELFCGEGGKAPAAA
jgi:hypothetical protein